MEPTTDSNSNPHHSVRALVDYIREKPTLLVGTPTIECLSSFLSGWFWANEDRISDPEVWDRFEKYIATRYKTDIETIKWDRAIRFYSLNSVEAFSHFFDLFTRALNVEG